MRRKEYLRGEVSAVPGRKGKKKAKPREGYQQGEGQQKSMPVWLNFDRPQTWEKWAKQLGDKA